MVYTLTPFRGVNAVPLEIEFLGSYKTTSGIATGTTTYNPSNVTTGMVVLVGTFTGSGWGSWVLPSFKCNGVTMTARASQGTSQSGCFMFTAPVQDTTSVAIKRVSSGQNAVIGMFSVYAIAGVTSDVPDQSDADRFNAASITITVKSAVVAAATKSGSFTTMVGISSDDTYYDGSRYRSAGSGVVETGNANTGTSSFYAVIGAFL